MEAKYYYIIGVKRMLPRDISKPTKLVCDFVIEHTEDDVKKIKLAKGMVDNELCPTSQDKAIKAVGARYLVEMLQAVKLRANANQLTVHKFKSEFRIEEEWFDIFVETANFCEDTRKKLKDAQIRI